MRRPDCKDRGRAAPTCRAQNGPIRRDPSSDEAQLNLPRPQPRRLSKHLIAARVPAHGGRSFTTPSAMQRCRRAASRIRVSSWAPSFQSTNARVAPETSQASLFELDAGQIEFAADTQRNAAPRTMKPVQRHNNAATDQVAGALVSGTTVFSSLAQNSDIHDEVFDQHHRSLLIH